MLCPNQSIPVHDTVIDGLSALALDTTITGYPLLGSEPELTLMASGDTIDVRGIIRFDSIPYRYIAPGTDTNRSASQVFNPYVRLIFDTLSFRPRDSLASLPTISVYDLDTLGSDTSVAVLSSLFRPDRFLGLGTVSIKDSIRIGLNPALILPHVIGDHLIRLGFKMTGIEGAANARASIQNATSGFAPVFSYRADTDTVHVTPFTSVPKSTSPYLDSALSQRLLNYPLIVAGTSPPVGQHLDVGGMPARRTFVRFVLPSRIIDSATVVRATLTLTLMPNALRGFYFLPPDSIGVLAEGIISTPTVTDPGHAAGFNASSAVIGIDTSYFGPSYSDSINVEFVDAARHWKARAADTVSRAIVLVVADEGGNALGASFYPALPSVPAAQRPHVHLAYIKPVGFGLP